MRSAFARFDGFEPQPRTVEALAATSDTGVRTYRPTARIAGEGGRAAPPGLVERLEQRN